MKTIKLLLPFSILSLLLVSVSVFAALGDRYSVRMTVHMASGEVAEQVVNKSEGETLNIIAKPQTGFKSQVLVDGEIVIEGQVNKATRYRLTVIAGHFVEIYYLRDSVGSELQIGRFIDSEVEGLGYRTTSGLTGKTNQKGEFQYSAGDDVEFFIGNISLGSVSTKGVITPFDFSGSEVKIARLMQTVDYDAQPNNGILISGESYDIAKQYPLEIKDFSYESNVAQDMLLDLSKGSLTGGYSPVYSLHAQQHAVSSLALEELKDSYISPLDNIDSDSVKLLFSKYVFGHPDIYKVRGESGHLIDDIHARVKLYAFDVMYSKIMDAEAVLLWRKFKNVEYQNELWHGGVGAAFDVKSLSDTLTSFNKLAGTDSELINALSGAEQSAVKEILKTSSSPVFKKIAEEALGIGSVLLDPASGISHITKQVIDLGIDLKSSYDIANIVIEMNSYFVARKLFESYIYHGFERYQLTEFIPVKAKEVLRPSTDYLGLGIIGGDLEYSVDLTTKYFRAMEAAVNRMYWSLNKVYTFNNQTYFRNANTENYLKEFEQVTVSFHNADLESISSSEDSVKVLCVDIENNSYISLSNVTPFFGIGKKENELSYALDTIKLEPREEERRVCFDAHFNKSDIQFANPEGDKLPIYIQIFTLTNQGQDVLLGESIGTIGINENSIKNVANKPIVALLNWSIDGANVSISTEGTTVGESYGELTYSWLQVSGPEVDFVQTKEGINFVVPEMDQAQASVTFGFKVELKSEEDAQGIALEELITTFRTFDNDVEYFLQFNSSSESLIDGSFIELGRPYTKTWKVTNISNLDLYSVSLRADSSMTQIVDDGISPAFIGTWKQGETITFTTQLTAPEKLGQSLTSNWKVWKFKVNGESIPYKGGNREAFLSYNLNLKESGNISFDSGVAIFDVSGGFRLGWNSATGIVTHYELYRSTSNGTLGPLIYSGPRTSHNDSGLTSGSRYYYTVKACNDKSCINGTQDDKDYIVDQVSSGSINLSSSDFVIGLGDSSDHQISWSTNLNVLNLTYETSGAGKASVGHVDLADEDLLIYAFSNATSGELTLITLKFTVLNPTTNQQEIIEKVIRIQMESDGSELNLFSAQITGLTPRTAVVGEQQTFIVNGVDLPSTIAMSLSGANCGSAYSITATSARLDCTAFTAGSYQFYVAPVSGQPAVSGAESLFVTVSSTLVDNIPTISYNTASNQTYSGSSFDLNITATDDIGLNLVAGAVYSSGGSYSSVNFGDNVNGTNITKGYSVNISSLSDGNYKIKLLSQDTNGQSSSAVWFYFSKGGSNQSFDLGTVSNLNATNGVYTNKVRVTWGSVTGATSYLVYRCSNTLISSCTQISQSSTLSYDDFGASPNTIYYYRIKAVNSGGTSSFSEYNAGTLSEDAVIPVTNAPVASDGSYFDKIYITWNVVAGADILYRVYRCETSSTNSCLLVSTRTNTSFNDKDYNAVQAGNTYYYRIKILSGTVEGNFSAYDTGFLGAVASTVQAPIASLGSYGNKVTVSWAHVTGAKKYEIYACDNFRTYPYEVLNASGCRGVVRQSAFSGDDGSIVTQTDDSVATPGVKYWYYVRAENNVGWGEFSEKSNSGYVGLSSPLVPTIDTTTYDDSWVKLFVFDPGDHGAEFYELFRCTTTSTESCISINNNSPYEGYYDTGIAPNTDYYYRAKSVNYLGNKSAFGNYNIGRISQ